MTVTVVRRCGARWRVLAVVCVAALVGGVTPAMPAARAELLVSGTTVLVSVNTKGEQPRDGAIESAPAVSADGRYVAFDALDDTLVPGDTNSEFDVFLRDTHTGKTTRVSVGSGGVQARYGGGYASLSADGRYVAFQSYSSLVTNDRNSNTDVYVHDRVTRRTRLVSVTYDGHAGNGYAVSPSISADGRYVAFMSAASNLAAPKTRRWLTYVRDMKLGRTVVASLNNAGAQANRYGTQKPAISADGRWVAFESNSTNLAPGTPADDVTRVYVRDLKKRKTIAVSVSPDGKPANDFSDGVSISADGRYVAFNSGASNIVPVTSYPVPADDEIFVRDVFAETTEVVSLDNLGNRMGSSAEAVISADGRYVAFRHWGNELLLGDDNGSDDIYVHDRETQTTSIASVHHDESLQYGDSFEAAISADGRHVAFWSWAELTDDDTTIRTPDVFIRTRAAPCGQPLCPERIATQIPLASTGGRLR
jgi:Tol biopolymer transport system component